MVKEIQFEKNASGAYESSFISTGKVTFQALRKSVRSIAVMGNLPGMDPVTVSVHDNRYEHGIIFGIDLPVGVNVTLKTGGEIIKAMVMSND